MPRDTRIEDWDIVNQDALIQALLEYYEEPHTIKQAQAALLDYHPDDIARTTRSLRTGGFLNISAKAWMYFRNANGNAHLYRLQKMGYKARRMSGTEIPT